MVILVNWVDVSVAVVLLIGAVIGLFQGLVRQALFALTAYVALVLAAQYHTLLAAFLTYAFPQGHSTVISLAALAILFFLACIVLNALTVALYRTRVVTALAALDHIGGAALGTASMWVILSFVMGIAWFSLAVPWLGYEDVRYNVESMLQTSLFRQSLGDTLPLLSEAVKPWFPAGLPAILFM
ncbi:MAG: CvpA family protein [Chloroflexota bacterium]